MSEPRHEGSHEYHLWYTRRDGVVRGPFPEPVVQNHILLGRLRESDELSRDKVVWRRIAQLPELIPEVMRHVVTEEDKERLRQARLRADERLRDRRGRAEGGAEERRRSDRREAEPEELLRHRALWNDLGRRLIDSARVPLLRPTLLIVLVGTVLAAAFHWYSPGADSASPPDCSATARPGVNWSYCRLDGAALAGADLTGANLSNAQLPSGDLSGARLAGGDLAYVNLRSARLPRADLRGARLVGAALTAADLSGADLTGADLSYASLQSARLSGAVLSGARLDQAIWTDGRLCATGSVGGCR